MLNYYKNESEPPTRDEQTANGLGQNHHRGKGYGCGISTSHGSLLKGIGDGHGSTFTMGRISNNGIGYGK